jgi:cytoskeletal protein CcmA (bactofilin family)
MLGKGKKTESGNAASPDRSAESKGTSFLSRASGREEKTIIGEHISIEGSISGREDLEIAGSMKGNIKSHEKVELTREADFYGEIRANSISVEDGAYIKGVIELDREPNRKSSPGTAASARGTGSGPPAGGDKKET